MISQEPLYRSRCGSLLLVWVSSTVLVERLSSRFDFFLFSSLLNNFFRDASNVFWDAVLLERVSLSRPSSISTISSSIMMDLSLLKLAFLRILTFA